MYDVDLGGGLVVRAHSSHLRPVPATADGPRGDARKGGRTAYYRMLQGGTARIGEHHSTDESCKGHAASGGQAIPLEGIWLLALLR